MIFTPTGLRDAIVIDVERRGDERGYLARTFCEQEFAENGLVTRFVQASTIFSPQRGTLRGLHFQEAPHGEVKVVRCTRGAARVTIVDLRPDSCTYTQWTGVELSPENGRLLYVPMGFAQGYQTLVDDTEVAYQMSHKYVPEAASGVRWDDPAFGIQWPPAERRIISPRDRAWPDYRVQSRRLPEARLAPDAPLLAR
ncbi:MAG TPA: dTDP-4-dehydrorhamnose 3,5-epimerase [Solirubrobacteraceae bacterium]